MRSDKLSFGKGRWLWFGFVSWGDSLAASSVTQPLHAASHFQSSGFKTNENKEKRTCFTNPYSASVQDSSKCLESWVAPVGYQSPRKTKSGVVDILKFITDRMRRWDKVPANESLSVGPRSLHPVRVVFVITADLPESEVVVIARIQRRREFPPFLQTR